jgi:hypothetical protein
MAWVDPSTRSTGYTIPATEWNQNTVENPQALRDLLEGGTAGQILTAVGGGTISDWATPAGYVEQSTSSTGAQHNVSLSSRRTYLRCTGTAPEFSGFTVGGAAPAAGDTVIVDCLGTTTKVFHESSSSTAANRIICPSSNGQIVGASGRMLLVYDATTSRWRESLIDTGAPITVTFNAGDYTADTVYDPTAAWTVDSGDVVLDTYIQRGNVITLNTIIVTSSTTGFMEELRKAVPGGFSLSSYSVNLINDLGSLGANIEPSYIVVKSGVTTYLAFPAQSAFYDQTNTIYLYCNNQSFEVD